ncbi:hypothetical protein [Pantoea sp. At-9b]|uniref:hypothetical protein n=1 Tax=Pantoea sp. (strain At-9b) TaxID=592316 RepID=UPI0001B3E535|nr:hypothetical protein [Pantoea sp. At-9b]ADU71573.1 hypothetical protein Pat9b_5416 [Pantoea sp. At-9b]
MQNSNSLNVSIEEMAKIVSTLDPFNEELFVSELYDVVLEAIREIENTSDKYFCEDEDKITNLIAMYLRAKGYDATEQTKSNGSVDLTVRDRNNRFRWLAEAKRGNSYSGVFEGMLQLMTRYVTNDKNAGFFIYYQKSNPQRFLNNWYNYLNLGEYSDYKKIENCMDEVDKYFVKNPLASALSETINYFDYVGRTKYGNEVKVRNFIANLHFNPVDKSGRGNASILRGQSKNKIVESCETWCYDGNPPSDINEFLKHLMVIHPEYFE